jgi:hypothetical protein
MKQILIICIIGAIAVILGLIQFIYVLRKEHSGSKKEIIDKQLKQLGIR